MPNEVAPAPYAPAGVRLRLKEGADPLRVRAGVEILASHPDYSGHFPERPVLPASSQFEIIEAVVRAAFGDTLRLAAVPRAKFLGIIEPGTALEAELAREDTASLDFNYSLQGDGKVYSRGKIRFSCGAAAPADPAADVQ